MLLTDELLSFLRFVQITLFLSAFLWLMLGSRIRVSSSYGYYLKILYIYLPACTLSYISIVLSCLIARWQQGRRVLFLIMLCLTTLLIEKLLLRAIRLRRRFEFFDQMLDTAKRIAEETFPALDDTNTQGPTLPSVTEPLAPSTQDNDNHTR